MEKEFTFEAMRMTVEMIRSTQVNQYAESDYHVLRVLDYINEYMYEAEHQDGVQESIYEDLNVWLSILIKEDDYIRDKEQCKADFDDAWRVVTNTESWLDLNIEE